MREFELPVTYKDRELLFPAAYIPAGFTHRIRVIIDETEVFFEPDEEGSYRALVATNDDSVRDKIDKALLEAVLQSIIFVFG
jgi:hypothetical protein